MGVESEYKSWVRNKDDCTEVHADHQWPVHDPDSDKHPSPSSRNTSSLLINTGSYVVQEPVLYARPCNVPEFTGKRRQRGRTDSNRVKSKRARSSSLGRTAVVITPTASNFYHQTRSLDSALDAKAISLRGLSPSISFPKQCCPPSELNQVLPCDWWRLMIPLVDRGVALTSTSRSWRGAFKELLFCVGGSCRGAVLQWMIDTLDELVSRGRVRPWDEHSITIARSSQPPALPVSAWLQVMAAFDIDVVVSPTKIKFHMAVNSRKIILPAFILFLKMAQGIEIHHLTALCQAWTNDDQILVNILSHLTRGRRVLLNEWRRSLQILWLKYQPLLKSCGIFKPTLDRGNNPSTTCACSGSLYQNLKGEKLLIAYSQYRVKEYPQHQVIPRTQHTTTTIKKEDVSFIFLPAVTGRYIYMIYTFLFALYGKHHGHPQPLLKETCL